MSRYNPLRQRADAVRRIPLETVLVRRGAIRDVRDKTKWHTEQGPVSVTGIKFFDWHRGLGGGGAIDLVMHLDQTDFPTAVAWLENYCMTASSAGSSACQADDDTRRLALSNRSLRLPVRDDRKLGQVRRYLQDERLLPAYHLETLIEDGTLYADLRGNAVFLLLGRRLARSFAGPGHACGGEWPVTLKRTVGSSGSARRTCRKSFSASRPSMRSAALHYHQIGSASRLQGHGPIPAGLVNWSIEITTSIADSTPMTWAMKWLAK